jgi:hypothetical protein
MAILEGDIKLLKSAVLDDVPEGGGMATGAAVLDGVSNNLFPDISELDRTYGRIALRKVFPAVLTDTVDGYYGANIIVAKAPADPKVSVTLFTTKSWSDTRTAAQAKLESYLALGAETRFVIYGNHLVGQRSVQVYCRNDVPSPGIGDVIALVQRDNAANYQYVRITRIISRFANQIFTDQNGDFTRDVLVLEISDPLRLAFAASAPSRYSADVANPPTRIYSTFAADATSYYGVAPLAEPAALGALTFRASSIFSQLVPSALAEAPIVDARCTSDRETIVQIDGAPALTLSTSMNTAAGEVATRYFGSGFARGSLSLSAGGATLVDDGNGKIVAAGGFTGTVDYASGSVSLTRSTPYNGAVTGTAQPAAAIAAAGHTASTAIAIGNRGYNYVKSLIPVPAPGSISLDYMSQGKWYRLYDNGAGNLVGDLGIGTGVIDYATGSLIVTLGALPDVNTEIIYAWGSPAHYESHVGSSIFSAPTLKFEIPGGALEPGQLSMTYTAGGVTKTVTDDGAGGLTGHGSGRVYYATGKVRLVPSLLPDGGTSIVASYKQGMIETELKTASGALTSFTLAHAVQPKSLSIEFQDGAGGKYTVVDDGTGVLVFKSADVSGAVSNAVDNIALVNVKNSASVKSTAGIHGTINYSTGEVALNGQITLKIRQQSYYGFSGYVIGWNDHFVDTVATGTITCRYRQDSDAVGTTQTYSAPAPVVTLDLLPTIANAIVPSSLRVVLGGAVYVDRGGILVKDPSPSTNSGTAAGTINYATGVATFAVFNADVAASASVSCLTRRGLWTEWQIKFRISGAPIQPASLALRANRADDSVQVTASSALAGTISGAAVGSVDYQFGIASVQFGAWVADSSLTAQEKAEWWYDAANVVAGQIFRPVMVLPDTARFNAVAVSNLPLSAEVLGLDPVRLPVDGKVPILRKGDTVVVHHTAETAPTAVSNGQTINVGRERIARLRVVGADGATITSGYSSNLDAGTVTFSDVTGYSQPVKIEHRIEDMRLCSDVQINGELAIISPLTHDFPLGSLVSSALLMGDLHARVSVFFDQATWSVWSDTLVGNAATGTYNKTQYPPVVTNRGAILERWEIIFTNSNTVNVIGETVGQIVTEHAIVNDLAPINPATGVPYFELSALGWGAGWSAGNVVRLNTVAANFPVYVARTVLQGNPTQQSDQFTLGIRGDIDRP